MKVDVSNQYSTSADVVPSQHSILSNGFFGESENLQIDLSSMAMPLSPLSPKSNIVRSRIARARHGSILSLPSRMRSPDLIDQFFSTRQSRAPITLVDQAARKRSISRTRKMSISLRKLGSFMMSGNVSDGPDGRLQRIFHSLLCRSSHGARFISRSAQILRTVRILRLMSIHTRRSITVAPLSRTYSPESQGGDSTVRRSSNSSHQSEVVDD
eukprot:807343_1